MLYISLLKCICIIFTNQNTHYIFYYKTLGNVTLRYAIGQVTPVFTTSMKYWRSYISNQPGKRIHQYHGFHGIKSGPHQYPSARDSGVSKGPCEGFLLSALQLCVLHPQGKNRALLLSPWPQLISNVYLLLWWTVCSLKPVLEKSRPDIGEAVTSFLMEN